MTRPRLLLSCTTALVLGIFSTIGFADDGSDDADDAPASKTAHPHKAHKHATGTADVATGANAGKTSSTTPPSPTPVCESEGWVRSASDGKCYQVLATPVVGPGR